MSPPGHLLVVDDAPAALRLMVTTLEQAGHRVRPANSGELALAAIGHQRPELILLDIHMPGLSGLAVCDRLKADPQLRDIPILFISGANDVSERREGLRHGAVDFIVKPFDPEELLARVNNHLELARLRVRLTQQSEALQQAAHELEAEIGERRRAQEALQEKASRLALATQAGQIGIWDWDIVKNEVHWDRTLRRIYGLPEDEKPVGYETWEKILHPEDLERCRLEVQQALATSNEYTTEHRIIRSNGEIRHVRGRALIHHDASGRPTRMLGTNWDTTDQTRNQERLQLFSRTVEQSSAAVVITNVEGKIEYVNEKFIHSTGYTSSEMIGASLRAVLPADASTEEFDILWNAITHGKIWTAEFENRTKAGEFYWEKATILPVTGDDDRITHFVVSKEDITARRVAEEALRHEQWLITCLMETAPALIFFKDNAGRFIRVNQAQAAFFGLKSPVEILGRTHHEFFSPAEAAQATEDEQFVLQTGRPVLDKLEKVTASDGSVKWFSTSRMPMRDMSGSIIGTFGLSTDVTAQKKGEAERAQLQMQLTQAQKLESIGRLAAGIAHEINTPAQYVNDNISYVRKEMEDVERILAAHTALVSWLQSRPAMSPEVTEILESISGIDHETLRREIPAALTDAIDGMGRITKIVRAMKSFSHPGGEKMAPADLNQTIESTLIVCRNEWKYVAETETHFAEDLPLVPCLRADFSQVILNLVVNAAHAIKGVVEKSPSGQLGRITVTTSVNDGWAEVRISDTGTGIPEAVRSHIFEPFFTTKEVGLGTGQGLAMARSVIVERHKGTLTFETEVGRGTTFIIRLPLRQEPRPAPGSGP